MKWILAGRVWQLLLGGYLRRIGFCIHSQNALSLNLIFLAVRIDPMPDMEGRNLASNLRGIGMEQNNVPEWKQHITGGAKGGKSEKTPECLSDRQYFNSTTLLTFGFGHFVRIAFPPLICAYVRRHHPTSSSYHCLFVILSVTYGKHTSMSIIEQRQSLPIFKLKQELLKAVHDNQVLIVIGETGELGPMDRFSVRMRFPF